ncbi:MAG: FAD-dependent oxidoreductase [Oscillospiraceae bacterium]
MDTLWTDGTTQKSFPSLCGDADTDVLIIGGGMAGILCTYFLARAGVKCMLVEADKIGHGSTKGTTAVISAQHSTLYSQLIDSFSRDVAKGYLEANLEAVKQFRSLSEKFDCDFEERPSIIYSTHNEQQMRREANAVNSLGFPAKFTKEVPLGLKAAGAVIFPDMAQFHPLKFINSISDCLDIYENTRVTEISGNTASVGKYKIHAKKIIVATNFPFINRQGLYFLKLYQQRSYVIAVKNAPQIGCTIEELSQTGLYFRNYRDVLIVGGGGSRTGKKNSGYEPVERFISKNLPDAKEVCRWANQDCMSLDGIPYIGSYSAGSEDIYTATGFNAWGMTSSMAAARILSDTILGKGNIYGNIFAPNRGLMRPQAAANAGAAVLNLLTPTVPRCPHMGCALKKNVCEGTWDCPCHGSRFNKDGGLINGPAQRNAKP